MVVDGLRGLFRLTAVPDMPFWEHLEELRRRFPGETLFAQPRHPYTVGLLHSVPRVDAARQRLDGGATVFQFRLRLERAGDGDGRADLAMFYRTDSNTNQGGLFTLTLDR